MYIEAHWDPHDLLGEAQWVNQMNDGLIGAIVPFVDLSAVDANEQLAKLASIPLVKGIRQVISWHTDPKFSACDKDYASDLKWSKNFKLLENYG